jgi:hypothetical protein
LGVVDGRELFDAPQFHDDSAINLRVRPLIEDLASQSPCPFFVSFRAFCGHPIVPEKSATLDMCRSKTRFFGKTWFLFEAGCAMGWPQKARKFTKISFQAGLVAKEAP